MRKAALLFCLLTLAFFASAQRPIQYFSLPEGIGPADYMPGRVMAKVKAEYRGLCNQVGIQHPLVDVAMGKMEVSRVRKAFPQAVAPQEAKNRYGQAYVDLSRTYEFSFPPTLDVETAVNYLLSTDVFEYAEPAYIYKPFFTPNDPDLANQYYLPLVQAFAAWDISQGDSTIVLAIIDTGTSFTHPDLVGKNVVNAADPVDGIDNEGDGYIDNISGWDFGGDYWDSPGDNDPTWGGVTVASDHGIICAGPALATINNNLQIAGIGYNCKLMGVKVSINETPLIYYGYQGVVYAADHGAQILNLSWGGSNRSRFGEDAINYAIVNKEVMVVAAAGNTPSEIDFFPASYPHVISCGGSEQNDAFWNTTSTFGTTYHPMVDICAPSEDILTTFASVQIGSFTGTSLGAPMVCAAAGLVKARYPNLTMAQVAERVRVTADQGIYNLNPATYSEKMGRGRLNALRALQDTTPSVRILDVAYDDGNDGLIQVGDTVSVRVRFMNYLEPVQNLQIGFSTPDWGQFQILTPDVYAGNVGTLDTVSTWICPFKLVIRAGTPAGFEGYLRFAYDGVGYSDWEYYPLTVQANYVHVDAGRIETSMNGTGRWGFAGFPSQGAGKGLILDGVASMMGDAGFLIGNSQSQVSNNIENQTGTAANAHFTNVTPIARQTPGPDADLEAHTVYSDAGAGGSALGVRVSQNTYQWGLPPYDDFIIQEYQVVNTTGAPLTGLYAGMYMNLNMFWRDNNTSLYDTLSRTIYNFYEQYASIWDFGISLLTPDSLHGSAVDENTFPYTIAAKYNAISSPPQSAILANANLAQFASAGPFDVQPGDTHTVAFALVLGDSLREMREASAKANLYYWCLVRGGMTLRVDLGADIYDCDGGPGHVLDAGVGFSSYLWNTGATSQSITTSASGEYWVMVTDANGCVDYDRIQVTQDGGINGAFASSPLNVLVGDTVTFTDLTANGVEWCWDFGDGSALCPIQQTVSHAFTQYGSYQVTMYVGNGICIDTVVQTIVVDTLVGIKGGLAKAELMIWPNPARGGFQYALEAGVEADAVLLLHDAMGRVVLEQAVRSEAGRFQGAVQAEAVAKGLYFLELRSGGQRWLSKLVLD